MQNNSIKGRLRALESAKGGGEDIRLRVIEQLPEDDPDFKSCSAYIIDKCEAACDSDETFDNALGAAFIAVTGENPLIKKGIVIIDITPEIAMRVVDVLALQGIEVKL